MKLFQALGLVKRSAGRGKSEPIVRAHSATSVSSTEQNPLNGIPRRQFSHADLPNDCFPNVGRTTSSLSLDDLIKQFPRPESNHSLASTSSVVSSALPPLEGVITKFIEKTLPEILQQKKQEKKDFLTPSQFADNSVKGKRALIIDALCHEMSVLSKAHSLHIKDKEAIEKIFWKYIFGNHYDTFIHEQEYGMNSTNTLKRAALSTLVEILFETLKHAFFERKEALSEELLNLTFIKCVLENKSGIKKAEEILYLAAHYNRPEIIEKLYQQGIVLPIQRSLNEAISQKGYEVMEKLLAFKASENDLPYQLPYMHPLELCVKERDFKAFSMIVKARSEMLPSTDHNRGYVERLTNIRTQMLEFILMEWEKEANPEKQQNLVECAKLCFEKGASFYPLTRIQKRICDQWLERYHNDGYLTSRLTAAMERAGTLESSQRH